MVDFFKQGIEKAMEENPAFRDMRRKEQERIGNIMSYGDSESPAYRGITDEYGNLLPQFQVGAQDLNVGGFKEQLAAINPDQRALEALRQRGLSEGPSRWADLMMQQQGLEEQKAREGATAQAMSGAQQAQTELAMRGGIGAGARERLAAQSAKNMALQRQQIAGEGAGQRLGILTQDEQQRLGVLQQLPGQELQAAGFDLSKLGMQSERELQQAQLKQQADIAARQAAIQDIYNQNLAAQQGYQQKMQVYGAERQAQAIEDSGK